MSQEILYTAIERLRIDQSYSTYTGVANIIDQFDTPDDKFPLLKVAVLRNFTVEPLLPVLKGEIVLAGFYPRIFLGGYDAIAQDILDPGSELYRFDPGVIFVLQWLEAIAPDLVLRFPSLISMQVNDEIERVLNFIEQNISVLRKNTRAQIVINNFPLPAYSAMGILDAQSDQSQMQAYLKLNLQIKERLKKTLDVFLLDLMGLMARIGSQNGIDERYWQLGRAPLGRNVLVPIGREYGKFVRALHGKVRKCLVLDCDNVLWSGVVGEEGVKSIHQDFQREVLNLHDRGVILALCSKNNEADVGDVFKNHPDMILREKHFAARQVNWEDKATNLIRIAEQLNIGLDSLVFADDSLFECDLVRERLPQVTVLCLSKDPSSFRAKLQETGYFDTLVLSDEDKKRNQMYRDDTKRKSLSASAVSLEDYLTRLHMVAEIGLVNEMAAARVSQLTQKTNQFNLTTRRYTESEIKVLMGDSQADVLYLKLVDDISDLGLVGVVIMKYQDQKAVIDTFLLSCRVLGRGVEDVLLAQVLTKARQRGCQQIIGEYIPSAKNGQVADFYRRHGFHLAAKTDLFEKWQQVLDKALSKGPNWITAKVI